MALAKRNLRLTVVGLCAFVGLIAGLFVSLNWKTTKEIDLSQFEGTILHSPREINTFSLTKTDGSLYSADHLKGQWTLMFFGFTSCGSICPVTMSELAKTYKLLLQENIKPLPQVVMVSLDPQRDSLDKLNAYVHAYHRDFYGARGSLKAVKKMAQDLGVLYEKSIPSLQLPENYNIQHSGTIMIFNPKGQLAGFFTMPHKAKSIVKDYKLLIDYWK